MDKLIDPIFEWVTEQLVQEGILFHNRIQGRRRRIYLEEVLKAGKEEPRILEVIPAVISLKPHIIAKCKRDLKNFPDLEELLQNFDSEKAPPLWRGIAIKTLQEQQRRLYQLWQYRHRKTKWRNINIRVSEEDIQRLNTLAVKLKHGNKSEVIRQLISEAS